MKNWKIGLLAGVASLFMLAMGEAQAQQVVKICSPVVNNSSGIPVTSCQDVNASNPLPVTATLTPSATPGNVNLTQVGGSTVSGVNFSSATVSPAMNGIPSASILYDWDPISSTLQKVVTPYGDNAASSDGILSSGNMVFDGTNWDRMRAASAQTAGVITPITGIPAVQLFGRFTDTESRAVPVAAFGNTDVTVSSSSVLGASNFELIYNPTTNVWERRRGNYDSAAIITLTAATASVVNSPDQTNYNSRGVNCLVNISAATTVTLTVKLQGKDAASGVYYDIPGAVTTALATTGSSLLQVYPGTTPVANSVVSQVLPRVWRAVATVVGTSVSATVGTSVIN